MDIWLRKVNVSSSGYGMGEITYHGFCHAEASGVGQGLVRRLDHCFVLLGRMVRETFKSFTWRTAATKSCEDNCLHAHLYLL